MVTLRCKLPGVADIDPELFTDEIRAFNAIPEIQGEVDLGENRWWTDLRELWSPSCDILSISC